MISSGDIGLTNVSLLLLRIITGIVFFSSGWGHVTKAAERSKSIGLNKEVTFLLGCVELAGAIGVMLGFFIRISTMLLIVVMLGAIYKKIFVWNTRFYEDKGYDWHSFFICMSSCFFNPQLFNSFFLR